MALYVIYILFLQNSYLYIKECLVDKKTRFDWLNSTTIHTGVRSRMGNGVRDPNKLLTHERYIKMKNWYINTFLIKTTSNYFWASEVVENQSFQIKVLDSPIYELASN